MSRFPATSDRTFLESLIAAPSPVGYEAEGQKVWMGYLEGVADRVEQDSYGSAVARLDVNADVMTVMLEAHADEIGMVVQYISEKGFVYLNKLGGSDSTIARGKRAVVYSRKGKVFGVIGNTAIHLQDRKNGGAKQPEWKEIFLDIGAESREEALEMVQVGDPVTYLDGLEYLNEELVTGRALDNRMGGFAIAMAMKALRERRKELRVNVLALNSVQEEVGGFGARMMSYRHMPDAAIVTDVTHATDTPGIDQRQHGMVELGKGPSVQHGGANHPALVRHLEEAAKAAGVDVQHEATSVRTGTDTDSIFYQRSGIPSALVSLPLRYMHSPVEVASLRDLEGLVQLMTEAVLALEPDQEF